MAQNRHNKNRTVKDTTGNLVRRMLFGNVITSEFFKRHWMILFILGVLILIYISTKYQCMTKMERIKELETELSITHTESIRERSTYMSRIRESSMKALVDSLMPGLGIQEQPPYHLGPIDNDGTEPQDRKND